MSNENGYKIRPEVPADHREVENLIRDSFWNVYRPGCSEHYVIHVLRDDPAFIKELYFRSRDGAGRQTDRSEHVYEDRDRCGRRQHRTGPDHGAHLRRS